ncbi:MAG: MaoC family dehydratase [Alphaproteobacteria bacterium]|nr:MaoC family dehydratase [Alphaproteobacteria bacterium]
MFPAYRQIDATFVELTGVAFEDFAVGQVFEHRPGRTVSIEDCRKHSMHALDLSARNIDAAFTARVHDRQTVPETFLLSLVAIMSTKTFGRVVANLGWTNAVLPEPAYVGDTLYAESEILGKRESTSRPDQGIMHVATRGFIEHGTLVCSYERRFLIYRSGHGPYRAAGY